MITASEFHDFAALCISTSDTNGSHNRFCAGIDKPDFIHRRNSFFKHFSKLNFELCWGSVKNTILSCSGNCLRYMWVSMAGNDRSIGLEIVDIFIAIYIPEVRSTGTFHKYRCSASNGFKRAGRAIYTSNDMLKGFVIKLLRCGTIHNVIILSIVGAHGNGRTTVFPLSARIIPLPVVSTCERCLSDLYWVPLVLLFEVVSGEVEGVGVGSGPFKVS
ncbi:hypothetical protein D3C78_1164400 [compost metagenome]